jgi:hypothetical protein
VKETETYIVMMANTFAFIIFVVFVVDAFGLSLIKTRVPSSPGDSSLRMSMVETKVDPLLLRAARGEKIERIPVWMMRQAGRHMKVSCLDVSVQPIPLNDA